MKKSSVSTPKKTEFQKPGFTQPKFTQPKCEK